MIKECFTIRKFFEVYDGCFGCGGCCKKSKKKNKKKKKK